MISTQKKCFFFLGFVFIFLFSLKPNHGLIDGHSGWVSSHNLTIASNSTAKTGYVGYTTHYLDKNGKEHYYYFSRVPILTYALIGLGQKLFSNNKIEEITHARYMMLIIYFLTFVFSFLFILKLSKNFFLSASAALMTFSSAYFLEYKDLVSPDMLTNLGLISCLWGIYFFESGRKYLAFFIILLSLNLGWGFSQLPVLGLWFLYHTTNHYKSRKGLKSYIQLPVNWIFLFSILLVLANILYNCYQEAHINNVSIMDSEVISSATNRLSVNESFNTVHTYPYYRYFFKLFARYYRSFSIFDLNYSLIYIAGILFSFTSLGSFLFIKRKMLSTYFDTNSKRFIILLLVSGLAWALPMKSLFAHHDYTTMNLYGVTLVLFLWATFYFFKTTKAQKKLFAAAICYFVMAHTLTHLARLEKVQANLPLIEDYARISQFAISGPITFCVEEPILPWGHLATDFFLSGHITVRNNECRYKISLNNTHKNLVSGNHLIYLSDGNN